MQTKSLVFIALFVAIIAVTGLIPAIPVPVIAVPITLQTLGVMLTGSLLGAKKGFVATLVFVLLVMAGAPFLPGGTGGLSAILGPAGGYIIGWPFGALVIGLFSDMIMNKKMVLPKLIAGHILGGILVIYAFGILYYCFITKTPLGVATIGNLAFIPGDTIKMIISIIITVRLKQRINQYTASRHRAAS